MSDRTGRFQIVFNGEIYNYRDLRAQLSAAGVVFRTQSDTEVILEAYRAWGTECLNRLNGMFALGLWDAAEQTLLLARDRLGKKPLFYRELPAGGIAFASEIKAFCEDRSFTRRLNMRALSQYLSLNYVLSSEAMFDGVTKLAPGHFALCGRDLRPRQHQYWNLAACFQRRSDVRTFDEAADALQALIDDAVRMRMISDVPLGLFLSGGLDSSTLAAAMCRQAPARDIRSFSMGFVERSYSELEEANATAAFLGINHQGTVTTADTADVLPAVVYYGDEPFADTSIIPMYLLSEFARKHVTVCLTGDGGDEVFGGYETYVADQAHHLMRSWPAAVPAAASWLLDHLVPVALNRVSWDYKLRQFLSGHQLSTAHAHYHWRTIFTESQKRALLEPDVWAAVSQHNPVDEFERFDREVRDAHYLNRAAYVDIKTWLVDDILVKADRASMAHGLELRAPLLDYRIVEFAASLPVSWKIKGLSKKRILRQSQKERLPAAVLRRRKQGFNAPVSHWLLGTFRDRFEALTLDGAAGRVLNRVYVQQLWREHASGQFDHGYRLLGLINLQLWLKRYLPASA